MLAAPDPAAPVVDYLVIHTEMAAFANVYLLLARHIDAHGRIWIEIRIPGRPNGRTGWVRRRALGIFHTVNTELVVDRERTTATLYRAGKPIWRARVGTGKPSTPTPPGHFWIREEFRVAPGHPDYGPDAFGTSDMSVLSDWPDGGVIGIHGTNEPNLIPGHPSHGCIRMHNADVHWLAQDNRLPIGTPVLIR